MTTVEQAPVVRVLLLGRSEELAVDLLTGLQSLGYRTECEQAHELRAFVSLLETRDWDLVICLSESAAERRQAAAHCDRIRHCTLFVAAGDLEPSEDAGETEGRRLWLPRIALDRLVKLIGRRSESVPCQD